MKGKQHYRFYIAASIALLTFIVFLSSLQNKFVSWDDDKYVYENPLIRSLDLKFLKSAFSEFHAWNYHPLTMLSHAVDYAIWGLNPLGHHLTNNILHALNTFLVVLLVMKLMEVFKKTEEHSELPQPFLNDRAVWITGAVTGLLFGLHPLRVEAVAWIADRKELLCAFFYLLSIYSYTNYVREINISASTNARSRFSNKKYLLSIGFFIFSLLSKPMAVSLPVVLLIFDWYPFRRVQSLKTFMAVFSEKIPFVVLSLVFSILTILAQKAGGALVSMQRIPLSMRLPIALRSLTAYLVKMILPLNLIPVYPYPNSVSLLSLEYIISIVIVIAITSTCIVVTRYQKIWLSVWSYYVITLIPVLGIVQVGGQPMGDRFTYLPSLGPFLVLGLTVSWLLEKINRFQRSRSIIKVFAACVASFVFAALIFLTVAQIGIWKNSIVFWSYVIRMEPGRVPMAYNNRGLAFDESGQVDRAIADFDRAIAINPSYSDAYYNRGTVFYKTGLFKAAMDDFDRTIALDPEYYKAYNNRGAVYYTMEEFDRAIADYDRAIVLNPSYFQAYYNRGLAFNKVGRFDEATKDLNEASFLRHQR